MTKQTWLKMLRDLWVENRKMNNTYFKTLILPFLPKIYYILVANYTFLKDPVYKIHYYFQLTLYLSYFARS
jgi:hypothetical protein